MYMCSTDNNTAPHAMSQCIVDYNQHYCVFVYTHVLTSWGVFCFAVDVKTFSYISMSILRYDFRCCLHKNQCFSVTRALIFVFFTVRCFSDSMKPGENRTFFPLFIQFNPDSPPTCIFYFRLSVHALSVSLAGISPRIMSAADFFLLFFFFLFQRQGGVHSVHLHRNIILLVSALFKFFLHLVSSCLTFPSWPQDCLPTEISCWRRHSSTGLRPIIIFYDLIICCLPWLTSEIRTCNFSEMRIYWYFHGKIY